MMYDVNSYFYKKYKIVNKYESIYKKHSALVLEIESELKECKCPKCGEICKTSFTGRYERHIEDVPYNFNSIWLHIHAHKFECLNPNCSKKYFDEAIPFARKNKVKTDNFIQFILTLSIFLSATSASLIISLLGSCVSADVVDNVIKKIEIKDTEDIEGIGVDDVAIKKGQSYATAIYDLKDHHLIALLEGRDSKEFKEWLENHKKIKTVARDRASAYAQAINEILPECTQVADRFHLFQNLIGHLKELFYSEMPEKILIKDGQILDNDIKKVPKDLANIDMNKLDSFDYNNDTSLDKNGNEIKFDNRLHDFDSKQYIRHKKNKLEYQETIIKIRERLKTATCHNIKKISEEFNISYYLTKKCKNMTDDDVKKMSEIIPYRKRKSKMDGYSNIIYKMLIDNIEQEYIFAYVKSKGCNASDRYLMNYINLVAKNNGFKYKENKSTFIKTVYPSDVIVITRYELLKNLLTIDNNKLDATIEMYKEIIFEKFPIAKQAQETFKNFHYIMFSADSENLDIFIELHKDVIPPFCNSIKKDIAAVKNAISLEINSGFVEGNNNKFKLIKRIVYGKSNLVNLLKRSYIGFMSTLDNFDISLIIEDVLSDKKR